MLVVHINRETEREYYWVEQSLEEIYFRYMLKDTYPVFFLGTVEMAYGSPFLLELGLSKSLMSLVWIAGPVSGLIAQPIFGSLSDRCTIKWGRRRPFLVGGTIVTILSMLAIGHAKDLAKIFPFLPNKVCFHSSEERESKGCTLAV